MSAVAVIPARGGSTRLKNKNIHLLGGKPLIRWTTEAVIASGDRDWETTALIVTKLF